MRRITWPVRTGENFPKYLKSLTLNCHTWQITWSSPPTSLKILSWLMSYDLRHRPPFEANAHASYHVTYTSGANFFSKWLKSLTPISLSLCNLRGSAIKLNWVFCQNSARPCVKSQRDVSACAKSRDMAVGVEKIHIWNQDLIWFYFFTMQLLCVYKITFCYH